MKTNPQITATPDNRESPKAACSYRANCAGDYPDCKLLNEKQAAPILGMSVSWMQKARLKRTGPPFFKMGRKVIYQSCRIIEYRNSTLQNVKEG